MNIQDVPEFSDSEVRSLELKNVSPGVPLDIERDLSGTAITDKYTLIALVGRGSTATVYTVENKQLGSVMAIKLLDGDDWTKPSLLEQFEAQAEAISKLKHRNLVPFTDWGTTNTGHLFLVGDFLVGKTLRHVIEESNGLMLPQVISTFEQLCFGLAAAHSKNVIHRDVNPDNIMILDKHREQAKLVDFGVARLAAEGKNQLRMFDQTGEVNGYPLFMSPEQCLGLPVDHRSDIYSLGAVIYTAMTGMPPFLSDSPLEVMARHVEEIPAQPSKVRPDLCTHDRALWVNVPDLEYIVLRCLEKDPEDRYQSVEEIQADLVTVQKLLPINRKAATTSVAKLKTVAIERGARPDPKVRELKGAIMGVVALAVVLAVVIFSMPNWQSNSSTSTAKTSPSNDEEEVDSPALQGDSKELTAKSLNHMKNGDYEEAIPLLKFIVKVSREKGESNSSLADNLQNLAKCYIEDDELSKAANSYEEALAIYRSLGSFDGSRQHECMSDYAKVLRQLDRTDEAEALEAEAKHLL